MIIAKRPLFILLCLTFTFAQNTISLSDEGDGLWSVNYNSDLAIGGFQFDVDGATINSASGGDATANGFMISAAGSTVLGFSLTGSTISAGDGVLLNLILNGDPTGLSNLVFSNILGSSINFEYVEDNSSDAYYVVNLEPTGSSQLTIFSNSITGLEVGDEVGVFDDDAITNYNDCSNQMGELLVGAGIWDGSQLNLVSIGSSDLCAFGGTQLSGFVEGNPVVIKVWRESEQMEYATELAWGTGTGNFGDIIQSISEITLVDPNACADDDAAVAAFGGCAGAVAALGCDFVFGGIPVSESCPETCGACGDETVLGCTDDTACNYDSDATDDDESCEYPSGCDNVCGSDLVDDACGVCGGDGSDDLGCGCFEAGPSGCDNACGSDLVDDACGV